MARIESTDLRTAALAVLALLAVFHTLRVAAELFMPVALAVLARFALIPVVRGLGRLRVPAPLAAALVVGGLVGLGALGAGALSEPAARWAERAPETLGEIERKLRLLREPVAQVIEATEEVAAAASARPPDLVVVEEPSLLTTVLDRTQSVIVTLLVTATLLLFLLASGDGFPGRSAIGFLGLDERESRRILKRIERSISRHLLTITLVNVGLGFAVALAMWIFALPSPMLWGVVAALLNFIPFVGAFVTAMIVGAVSLITFDDPLRTIGIVAVFLTLTGLEGLVITPALLGRRLTLRPSAVLLSVLFWSWLWGAVGALLAVPLLSSLRILWEQAEPLARTGEPHPGG